MLTLLKADITVENVSKLAGKTVNAKVKRYSYHTHWTPVAGVIVMTGINKNIPKLDSNESYSLHSINEIQYDDVKDLSDKSIKKVPMNEDILKRGKAMHWWNGLSSLRKTQLCDMNGDIVGNVRRHETLTGREIQMICETGNRSTV